MRIPRPFLTCDLLGKSRTIAQKPHVPDLAWKSQEVTDESQEVTDILLPDVGYQPSHVLKLHEIVHASDVPERNSGRCSSSTLP